MTYSDKPHEKQSSLPSTDASPEKLYTEHTHQHRHHGPAGSAICDGGLRR